MNIEILETFIKVIVLVCVLVIYFSSYSMRGWKKIKPIIMWVVSGGAILDLMGKFGKGFALSFIFILITVIVIWEKKIKKENAL